MGRRHSALRPAAHATVLAVTCGPAGHSRVSSDTCVRRSPAALSDMRRWHAHSPPIASVVHELLSAKLLHLALIADVFDVLIARHIGEPCARLLRFYVFALGQLLDLTVSLPVRRRAGPPIGVGSHDRNGCGNWPGSAAAIGDESVLVTADVGVGVRSCQPPVSVDALGGQ